MYFDNEKDIDEQNKNCNVKKCKSLIAHYNVKTFWIPGGNKSGEVKKKSYPE